MEEGTQRGRVLTLKADPERSFQPQTQDGDLIDIVPLLQGHGIGLADLRAGLRTGIGSQPMIVATATAEAISEKLKRAPVTLTGPELRKLRLDHPDLTSPDPAGYLPVNPITEPDRHCAHCGR